jgi:hypothetical protein
VARQVAVGTREAVSVSECSASLTGCGSIQELRERSDSQASQDSALPPLLPTQFRITFPSVGEDYVLGQEVDRK